MKQFLLWLAVLWPGLGGDALGQAGASLSGFVKDATSEETLLLAHVVLSGTQVGTVTNNAGYYTLTGLVPGTYTVVASYLGYRTYREAVTLAPGERRRLDILLVPDDVVIDEVVVSAEREEEAGRNIGVTQLATETVKQLPTVLEPDVFRALQLLPGVKASSDFSSGLYIRGGSPDQTLILLDRNTVYNPSHFFGFFSPFNPDAIKDVRLYKGGYPAPYGGRLGSVLDVYNKDGNRRELEGGLSVGLLASRAIVEGPYARGSWMLALRRSTLEPLFSVLRQLDVEGIPDGFYFYDLNGKVNYDASRDDRLSVSFYGGADHLDLPFLDDARFDLVVGNQTLSANWTHLFSQRLFSNFTLTSSRYFSDPVFYVAGTTFSRTNRVYDISAKGEFELIPNRRHTLKAGFWAGNFTMRLRDLFDGREGIRKRIQTFYSSVYVEDTFRPTPLWQVQSGLRANYFEQGGYLRLEPRFSVEYRPAAPVRLQWGYGRYYQFLTLITSELFSAFDVWLTTDQGVPPAYGDQFIAGVKTTLPNDLAFDVEVYYRTMRDLFELDPYRQDVAGFDYAAIFRFGDGHAYGAEFLLQKTRGRLNGFVGYTLGKTWRRFPDFPNLGAAAYYTPKHDRTHDLSAVVNYVLSRSWRATGVFTYATGQPYTEPRAQYKLIADPFGAEVRDVLVTDFNNARLPAYHRLDLGMSKLGRFFGLADYELQLQLINVYNRRNIWFYYFSSAEEDNTLQRTEVPQLPVPIPNISFTLRF